MREYSDSEKKMLKKVLPNIARELRMTMTNMHIAMTRLAPAEERERDPKVDQYAAVFTQSYYRMCRMLGNLSEASELAEDGLFFSRVNDDIVGLVRSVCERAEALFEDEGVTLVFESNCATHIMMLDASRIERMLFNLLSNALKFTKRGGTVTVRVHATRANVTLSVADTGRGIPPDELEHIFDGFLNGDSFRVAPRGMGLGLPLCRRIAQGHGGSILAESKVGKGSRFTVMLPNHLSTNYILREPVMEYEGGFNPTLVQLSDAVSVGAFSARHLD